MVEDDIEVEDSDMDVPHNQFVVQLTFDGLEQLTHDLNFTIFVYHIYHQVISMSFA